MLKLAFSAAKSGTQAAVLFDESMEHYQLLLAILIALQIKSYSSAFLLNECKATT